MTATGAGALRSIGSASEPSVCDQLVVHDLDDHLARRDRLDHRDADRLLLHLLDEGAHHVERDVGLEQRAAHLAQRGVDVGLAAARRAASGDREFRQAVPTGCRTSSLRSSRRVRARSERYSKTLSRPRAHRAVGRWPPASRGRSAGWHYGSGRERAETRDCPPATSEFAGIRLQPPDWRAGCCHFWTRRNCRQGTRRVETIRMSKFFSRRRLLAGFAAIGAVAGVFGLRPPSARYYDGPVSDHFDGTRFFDPHGSPPKSLADAAALVHAGARRPNGRHRCRARTATRPPRARRRAGMAPLLCRPRELAAADRGAQHPDRSGVVASASRR